MAEQRKAWMKFLLSESQEAQKLICDTEETTIKKIQKWVYLMDLHLNLADLMRATWSLCYVC